MGDTMLSAGREPADDLTKGAAAPLGVPATSQPGEAEGEKKRPYPPPVEQPTQLGPQGIRSAAWIAVFAC
jgi:hypothetical protein